MNYLLIIRENKKLCLIDDKIIDKFKTKGAVKMLMSFGPWVNFPLVLNF